MESEHHKPHLKAFAKPMTFKSTTRCWPRVSMVCPSRGTCHTTQLMIVDTSKVTQSKKKKIIHNLPELTTRERNSYQNEADNTAYKSD